MLLDRPINGSKTHAFVIGVGDYPHAKMGKGVQDNLRQVPDLPSAADSAKLVCDWLLDHQDDLASPLATLEVLISDPAIPNNRYGWANGPADPATEANVIARGLEWYERVVAKPGDVAFFYCCGHGASHLQQPVLFLEDLNRSKVNAWTHINLGQLALSFRKSPAVAAAFLFSDACGQYVPEFELGKSQESLFFEAPNLFVPSRNQVSLLCAAAEGQLAYEGAHEPGSNLKFGRFTQTLLKGLNGSSARWSRNRFGVPCRDLLGDLKSLRRVFFDHWGDDEPFEPYQAVTPTDPLPIVYPTGFELPLVVMTDPPDRMSDYGLVISQQNIPDPPWLKNRNAGASHAWHTTVPPGLDALYAIAIRGQDYHPLLFQPKEPLFDQWVPVP
ncbi:caspase family protein [Mesorhizobium sp. M0895]|uniref:caspase family protein n=1 Tax=Mesorhizobium sp. M0895 TaxID=2957019 RepID=UPI003337982E